MPTDDDVSSGVGGMQPGRDITLRTTLYDLISTVQEALEPEEETLLVPVVVHILHTRCSRWLGSANDIEE
jgi:hypothetical protein